jgi:phage FluMu protein Com
MKICCQHCGRYLFTATTTTIIEEEPCPGCGAKNNHKVIFSDDFTQSQLHHVHTAVETPPKKLKKSV